MSKIGLTYWTDEGEFKDYFYFQEDKLDLSSLRLLKIELAPLSRRKKMEALYLEYNQLQDIDLSPLSKCTNLRRLDIYHNQLQSIDLSPLSRCKNLEELYLHENQLQAIDLSPLSQCTNLSGLNLEGNQLQSIDLNPLSQCANLTWLNLKKNPLKEIDVTPLMNCEMFEYLSIDDHVIHVKPWMAHTALSEGDIDGPLHIFSWLTDGHKTAQEHMTSGRLDKAIFILTEILDQLDSNKNELVRQFGTENVVQKRNGILYDLQLAKTKQALEIATTSVDRITTSLKSESDVWTITSESTLQKIIEEARLRIDMVDTLASEYELRAIRAQVLVLHKRFADLGEDAIRTGQERTRVMGEVGELVKNISAIVKTSTGDPNEIRELVTRLEATIESSTVNESPAKSTREQAEECIVQAGIRIEELEFAHQKDKLRDVLREKKAVFDKSKKDLKVPENLILLTEMKDELEGMKQEIEDHDGLKSEFDDMFTDVAHLLEEHQKDIEVITKGTETTPGSEVDTRESAIITIQGFLIQASMWLESKEGDASLVLKDLQRAIAYIDMFEIEELRDEVVAAIEKTRAIVEE